MDLIALCVPDVQVRSEFLNAPSNANLSYLVVPISYILLIFTGWELVLRLLSLQLQKGSTAMSCFALVKGAQSRSTQPGPAEPRPAPQPWSPQSRQGPPTQQVGDTQHCGNAKSEIHLKCLFDFVCLHEKQGQGGHARPASSYYVLRLYTNCFCFCWCASDPRSMVSESFARKVTFSTRQRRRLPTGQASSHGDTVCVEKKTDFL